MDSTPDRKVGEGTFASAVRARDVTPIIAKFETQGVDEDVIAELASLIRRSGALICSRPDPDQQARRDGFFERLIEGYRTYGPSVDDAPVQSAIQQIKIAERGHHLILGALSRTDIAKEPANVRIAAAIARAEADLGVLNDLLNKAMAELPLVVPDGPMLRDDQGQQLSPDLVLSAVVETLFGTLIMEAYAANWFDDSGLVCLPDLPEVTQQHVIQSGSSQALAMSWLHWQRYHEGSRFLDDPIVEMRGNELPDGVPPGIETLYRRGGKYVLADWIANQRSIDRYGISVTDMLRMTNVSKKAAGIDAPLKLPPDGLVSEMEAANALALSEAVGYEIIGEQTRYGGLRLVQWVRGYEALSCWSRQKAGESINGIVKASKLDLTDLLQRLDFTLKEAETFLDAVSLGRKSRDLFDTPIVRTKTDWLLIGPALAAPQSARIIPSLLASRQVQIKPKGAAFEKRVLEFFKKQGLHAKHVKVKRDNAEYEFDVLVPWDGRLFLIECKNHTLSGNDPAQALFYLKELEADIEQVQRLAGALERWPEIISNEFNRIGQTEVIPLILHNETFSLPGPIDGVYVYDWSALTRFFKEATFGVAHDHRLPDNIIVRNRVAIKRIWKGEHPTSDDLIAELENPHQYQLLEHLAEEKPFGFHLDEKTTVFGVSLHRRVMSVENVAGFAGLSPKTVLADLAARDAEIEKFKTLSKNHTQHGSEGAVPEN